MLVLRVMRVDASGREWLKEQHNTREVVVYGHRQIQEKTPTLKKNQKSSLIKLLILKKCCVVAHGYIPGCCCSSYWADMSTPLGAWVLVNAKALGPQEGS